MLLYKSATSYFGIANAYIRCGLIANPTKLRQYPTKRRQYPTKRRQIRPNRWEVSACIGVCGGTEVTATEKNGCAVFASFLHLVTILGAKVEILKDFQCQLDINFIQIPFSFPT